MKTIELTTFEIWNSDFTGFKLDVYIGTKLVESYSNCIETLEEDDNRGENEDAHVWANQHYTEKVDDDKIEFLIKFFELEKMEL